MNTGESTQLKGVWESSSWAKLEKQKGKMMEKANSFIGSRSLSSPRPRSNSSSEVQEAIVVVDPFSTGAHLAAAICGSGLLCDRVLSTWDSPVASLVQEGIAAEFFATIQYDDQIPDMDVATDKVV